MSNDLSRRSFLAGLGGMLALFVGLVFFKWRRKNPPVQFHGPAMERGHQLRTAFTPPVTGTVPRIGTAIIGGGISGMSAGWYLQKAGYTDFRLFELENRAGGNSAWGENRIGRYPWGAHYLPTPGPDATYVHELLAEMGVYRDGKYGEEFLVHEPEERLFIYGNWQQGLIPLMGARASDRQQIEKFVALMRSMRTLKGKDGRRAFAIPLEKSSRDPGLLAWDKVSAAAYLKEHGFSSERLNWYIDYVLRDEYGSNRLNTSAWAFLHYFSARDHGGSGPAAGTDATAAAGRFDSHNLVWPEGNGFIAEYLRAKLGENIRSGTALRHVETNGKRYRLYFQDFTQSAVLSVDAEKIIFAAPKFILPYVYPALNPVKIAAARSFAYSPWLTVNLLVNHFAQNEPAWDNVTFGSKSLGYVVAEHQRPGRLPHARTLTFFHAFDADDTLTSRRHLLQMSEHDVYRFAITEMSRPHPGITEHIEDVGIYRWAHAMVRPTVGFMTGDARRSLADIDTNFFGAHSDISGMSNFEEAQYQGVTAAQKVLKS